MPYSTFTLSDHLKKCAYRKHARPLLSLQCPVIIDEDRPFLALDRSNVPLVLSIPGLLPDDYVVSKPHVITMLN